MLGEQAHRHPRVDVLGEHHDRGPGMPGADLARRAQALVGVGRRHADVDQGDVGRGLVDRPQQLLGRRRLARDGDPGLAQQGGDALADEEVVVGDHDAQAKVLVGGRADPSRAGPRKSRAARWTAVRQLVMVGTGLERRLRHGPGRTRAHGAPRSDAATACRSAVDRGARGVRRRGDLGGPRLRERPPRRAGRPRDRAQLGHARLHPQRPRGLVAAPRVAVRPAHGRGGLRGVRLEPLVCQRGGALHARHRVRPAAGRPLPARLPGLPDGPRGRAPGPCARGHGLRDRFRPPARRHEPSTASAPTTCSRSSASPTPRARCSGSSS